MDRDDRSSNLMFLLSLPLLAAACPGVDEGDGSSTSNTSVDPTTGGGTSHGDTSTSNGSAATSTSTSNGSVSTSSGGVDSETSEGLTDTNYGTTGEYGCNELPPLMGAVGQVCIDYTAKSNECYYDGMLTPECIMAYEAYCQYTIEQASMTYGEACGMAYEELYACLSVLTCEELADETPDCTDQTMTIAAVCVGM